MSTLRCNIVGRQYTDTFHIPLTPDDDIRLSHSPCKQDENAVEALAFLNGEWLKVGYVDRKSASLLSKCGIESARVAASQTNAFTVPICVQSVQPV